VQLVGSEANSVAGREGKKTLQPEHVLKALSELGFPEMVDECSSTLETFKEDVKGVRMCMCVCVWGWGGGRHVEN
jgi:hypothetical protein